MSSILNSDGIPAKVGINSKNTGDLKLPNSNEVFYCGRQMNQCRCGKCDGQCGPDIGCPCNSCVELLGMKVGRDGILIRNILLSQNSPVTGGHGRGRGRKRTAAGNIRNSSPNPVPLSEPSRGRGRNPRTTGTSIVRPQVQQYGVVRNRNGHECQRGSSSEAFGGDTGMEPKHLYYCGQIRSECRCGQCDGRCGPESGCPCNACLALVLGNNIHAVPTTVTVIQPVPVPRAPGQRRTELSFADFLAAQAQAAASGSTATTATNSRTPAPPPQEELDDSKLCSICLVNPKNCIILPCGHYAYCSECVESLDNCAICRGDIDSFTKVFEP